MSVRARYRLRFAKLGALRWISHRDLLRALERLFRRAELPLGMSEGFHPKPRMSFPLALAVGVAGLDEVMELELSEARDASAVLQALRQQAPPGLEFSTAVALPAGTPKAAVATAVYRLAVAPARQVAARQRGEQLLASAHWPVLRPDRGAEVDLRQWVLAIGWDEGGLEMQLRVTAAGTARPREVLKALGLDDLEESGAELVRTQVLLVASARGGGRAAAPPGAEKFEETSLPGGGRLP